MLRLKYVSLNFSILDPFSNVLKIITYFINFAYFVLIRLFIDASDVLKISISNIPIFSGIHSKIAVLSYLLLNNSANLLHIQHTKIRFISYHYVLSLTQPDCTLG